MTDVHNSTDSLDTSTKEQLSKCEAEIASLVQEIDNRQSMIEENVDENKPNELVKNDDAENDNNQSKNSIVIHKLSNDPEKNQSDKIVMNDKLKQSSSKDNLPGDESNDLINNEGVEPRRESSKIRQTLSLLLCCSASDQTRKTSRNKSQGLFSGLCSCTRRSHSEEPKNVLKKKKSSDTYSNDKQNQSTKISNQLKGNLNDGEGSKNILGKVSDEQKPLNHSYNRPAATGISSRNYKMNTPQKNGDSSPYTLAATHADEAHKNRHKYLKNVSNVPAESKVGTKLLGPIHIDDGEKKCLIIDLDETLVHSSFKVVDQADFKIGVEIDGNIHTVYVLKRPHVDEFLEKIGPLFECVLFTASLSKYADPVTDLLDQWNIFRYRLFRESCVFHRGNYVKDLDMLGRDSKSVAILDNSPASYLFHPAHALQITSWFDDPNDKALLDLIPYFQELASSPNSVPEFIVTKPPPSSATLPVTCIPNLYSTSTSTLMQTDGSIPPPPMNNIITSVKRPTRENTFKTNTLTISDKKTGKSSSLTELKKTSYISQAKSKSVNFLNFIGLSKLTTNKSIVNPQSTPNVEPSKEEEESNWNANETISPTKQLKYVMKSQSQPNIELPNYDSQSTANLTHNSMPQLTTEIKPAAPVNTNNCISFEGNKLPVLITPDLQKSQKQKPLSQPNPAVRSASLCLLHSLEDIPSDDDDDKQRLLRYRNNLCSDNLCNNTSHHLSPLLAQKKVSIINDNCNPQANNRLAITKLPFAASADVLLSS